MANNKKNEKRRVLIANKKSPFSYIEAYKTIRTNFNFITQSNEYKKIIVTSATPAEGKSNVVINLALSLAEMGKNVLVIDCDMRKPGLSKYLNISLRTPGLSNVLSNQSRIEDVVFKVSDLGFYVLPAGSIPPNPSELLASRNMERVIRSLEKDFDYILLDTPPAFVVSDALVLEKVVDGAILVVAHRQATLSSIKSAKESLEKSNIKIIGAILNKYDSKQSFSSDYNYNYDYYASDYSKEGKR